MDNEIDFEPEKTMEILTAWDDFKKIHEKEYNLLSEEEKKIVDRYHEFIAEKIKEVLVENGVRENIIKVVPEITSDLDGEGNWVVVDRHEESKGPSLTKPLKITFPSDSMIECLQRQGLADIGEFDWKEISKDLIEKKFKV